MCPMDTMTIAGAAKAKRNQTVIQERLRIEDEELVAECSRWREERPLNGGGHTAMPMRSGFESITRSMQLLWTQRGVSN
jgi:hypothetical protein